MLNAKKIREDFPIFDSYQKKYGKELAYLDSAASSQTPRSVVNAMDEYYFNYRSNVHRSPYTLGVEATKEYEHARDVVAKFIGAEKWEVIFTPGATMSANMLISMLEQNMQLSQSDEIVSCISDHHSNFVPFQEWASRVGATFRTIPLASTDLDYEAAESIISSRTKIVTLPLVSNVLGTVYDTGRILELAKKVGAIAIVDATTAMGHISVDARVLDCDFLFFSGHKMLGPTGIGILYGREALLTHLRPGFFGGGIIESVSEEASVYRDIPMRFEPGTPNIAGAIGLSRAIEYIHSVGLRSITLHANELVRYAIKKLESIKGVCIVSEKNENRNVGMVSFDVKGVGSHDMAEFLDRKGVCIRGGHHCAMPLMKCLGVRGVCRASFYIYNDEADVDALVSGIKKAQRVLA